MQAPEPLRILHADDDETFHLLVRTSMRPQVDAARCTFEFVSDGSEAVDYVLGRGAFWDRARFPLPHLILLDQRMKAMDGLEALQRIKDDPRGRRIPVFVFSTSAQSSLAEKCYEMGGAFCIEKPLDFERLGPTLERIVDFSINVLRLNESLR